MDLRQRVMVVDDDLAMCAFLGSFLETRGYEAFAVTHADEAIRRFRTERPEAVLLDIMLHGCTDGLNALAAFKKIDKDVPVIMISGEKGAATIVQAMKLGASDFVGKPFDDAELELALGNALKPRRLNHRLAPRQQPQPESTRAAKVDAGAIAPRAAAGTSAAAPPGHLSLTDISRIAARKAEDELILRMLTRTHWNRKETAEILGVSYKALLYKIKQGGLDKVS